MSKKMLKRSLALGALMAFVITGSAMAADAVDGKVYSQGEVNDNGLKGTNVEVVSFVGSGGNGNVPSIEAKSDIKVQDLKGIVYKGSWGTGAGGAVNVNQANKDKTLTFEKISSIATEGNVSSSNPYTVWFHAFGGNIVINDVDAINLNDGKNGFMARTYNKTDGSIVISNCDSIIINTAGSAFTGGNYDKSGTQDTRDEDKELTITVNANNIVLESGQDNACVNLNNSGTNDTNSISITANNKLSITGSNAVNANHGLENGLATVTLNASELIVTNNGNTYLNAFRANDYGKIVAIATDKMIVKGDISSTSNSVVELSMGSNGSFAGAIYKYDDSQVNINLGSDSIMDISSGTGEQRVTSLSGTGTVVVGDGDKLVVESNEAKLTVQQAGVNADTVEDQQAHLDALAEAVVDAQGSSVADTLLIEEGEVVGAVTANVEGGVVGKAVEAVNTVNQAIGEAAVNFKAHYRAHMNDMNKRMGELRMANGETGVWTRMVRGENEFEGAKSQYNQYQLGYDEKLSVDKRWTVGAAVTFAEGSGSFSQGSTEEDSTAFAIYGSKLNNDGTFVDLIARYAHLESDITMGREKADYSTNGYSVSAEFGKRIQQGNGLWIEPQVELTYGNVDSAEYVINGKNVTVGDMDSLIGRVGFSLGKDIKQGNVYARASYLYDFDGETDTTFGKGDVTRTIEEDLGGGWWEVGVGANISLSKATYIYADIEKTFGGEIDTNWQWNLGVRYSF